MSTEKIWQSRKLKFIGFLYSGLSGKNGNDFSKEPKDSFQKFIPFTSVTSGHKISNDRHFVSVKPYEHQNKVKHNDLVFLMSSETIDDIALASLFEGNDEPYLNSFCKAYRLFDNKIDPEFVNYYLSSEKAREYFKIYGRGFTRINLKQEYILNLYLKYPPLPEQKRIANFLDDKCTKIDKAIAQKERLIELLEERKQIIIQEAVTKGLPPSERVKAGLPAEVKMKDSGIAWIGEIPEGWEVKKCKFLFDIIDAKSEEGKEELLSVSHLTGVTPRSEKNVTMFMSEDYSGSKLCKKGDLVFNIMWTWMGALGVSDRTGIVSPSYGVYRQKTNFRFNMYFIEYLLKTTNYIEYYNKVSTGLHSSRLRFYPDMFMGMEIIFPSVSEQNDIVKFIESSGKQLDSLVANKKAEIEKLKEYKATLIDSVVTGKVRVGEDGEILS